MIKRKILELIWSLKDYDEVHNSQIKDEFAESRLSSYIIRLTHSIEKGLSIENPRLGFGTSKIQKILSSCDEYLAIKDANPLCLKIAHDALQEYFEFHQTHDFVNSDLEKLRLQFDSVLHSKFRHDDETKYGGTTVLTQNDMKFDLDQIEAFFNSRHSIRAFSGKHIDLNDLRNAIKLAQRAPSACNRQAVRVYLVPSNKYVKDTGSNLEGIGGFTDDVEYFLIITGKLSAYDEFEYKQFVVSSSIFAGYLTMTLHAYKIGTCVIQRSIRNNEQWNSFREKNLIPNDEQIVVMLGIGSMKDETRVPVSRRYEVDDIFRILN